MARKKSREDWKILENVFDQFTLRQIHYLSNADFFEELSGAIQVGKEANVFLAKSQNSFVIVKIYRLENSNFNKMLSYISSDPRFPSIKPNKRDIIFSWVLREYRNLLVSRQAGCRVPTPLINRSHILVEEFIEEENQNPDEEKKAAPQLKNVAFEDKEEVTNCFNEIKKQMKILYHKAKLVHGDLSEFNILYQNKLPVLIDFSQATSTQDYHAKEYLLRDCKNISRFFGKFGLEIDETELLEEIISDK